MKVQEYLRQEIESKKAIHMTLIDPDKSTPSESAKIASAAEKAGSSAIMIGGSLGVTEKLVSEIIDAIKEKSSLPAILFPGSLSGLSPKADAVWFLSVFNSTNPYYIVGAQAAGAVIIRKYNLEAISLAYIIVGEGGAAGYVSYARPIPYSKPEIAAAYALAAQYMGFKYVYLEAGSGMPPAPPYFIKVVRKTIDIPLIVGGGIKNKELAFKAASSGADIVVTGTIVEEVEVNKLKKVLSSIVEGVREGGKAREH
ncbi:MAG: geranylgeranylglyceryl/heptaprenylglyceryl phosphate synthase [Thermoprotei archaeon]|nr:MAG: geranylgeranylglyceryl/heptaprenylglyceryl phosphate synthase [Thermoprotei archaeon]